MRDGLVLTSGLRALLSAATDADHRAAPASPSDRGTTYVQDLPDLEDLCRSSCMAMRLTVQVQLILQALPRYPAKERYEPELSEEAGLQPGTAYPILLRLEHEGWVSSRCEDVGRASGEAPCSPLLPGDGGAVQASAAFAGAWRPNAPTTRRCDVSPRGAALHDASY